MNDFFVSLFPCFPDVVLIIGLLQRLFKTLRLHPLIVRVDQSERWREGDKGGEGAGEDVSLTRNAVACKKNCKLIMLEINVQQHVLVFDIYGLVTEQGHAVHIHIIRRC